MFPAITPESATDFFGLKGVGELVSLIGLFYVPNGPLAPQEESQTRYQTYGVLQARLQSQVAIRSVEFIPHSQQDSYYHVFQPSETRVVGHVE